MRDKFLLFVADVTRYASIVALTLATLFCVPSLEEFFNGALSAISMLARFLVALGISTLGVWVASRTLLRYAHQNLIDEAELVGANTATESEAG